jgi:hypothetical protein
MTDIRTTSAGESQALPAGAPVMTTLRLAACPACGSPAEVEWADEVESTSGPLELVRLRCLERHLFLMPGDGLSAR